MNDDPINGWVPPVVYDFLTDQRRVATQADIDRMEKQIAALSGMFGTVKKAVMHVEMDLKIGSNR